MDSMTATKTAFLYENYLNEMVCNEYYVLGDPFVLCMMLDEEGKIFSTPTEFKSFEEMAAYYDRRSQMVLVFNGATEEEAFQKLGTTLQEFSVSSETEDQVLADKLEKSGMFDKEYPVTE